MEQQHELSKVKGIGDARARWLEETFGARTLEQLGALEPDEIERRLRGEGRRAVSRPAIDAWVAEARELGKGQPEGEWGVVASFVVELQASGDEMRTSVHHLEKDETELWADIDWDRLRRWIEARLERPAPQEETPADVEPLQPATVKALSAAIVANHDAVPPMHIPIDGPWSVTFEWSLEGVEARLEGEWQLDVSVQPVAPAPPLRLREEPVRISAEPGVESYRSRYDVPAGTVTPEHCGSPYRATALLSYRPEGMERPLLGGFVRLGALQFFAAR
jgi:hypothetical protein